PAQDFDRHGDLLGDAVHGEVAGDVEDVLAAGRGDLGRLEGDLGELVGVEEVGAAEVLVAVGHATVDGGGLDADVDRRGGGAGGDAAVDAAAVGGGALAGNELLPLQAVEEPSDAGGLLDHPLGDLEGGKAVGAGAAKDAQDVVLLGGDAVRLDGVADGAADDV